MNILNEALGGVLLIEPDTFDDERGFFREVYQVDKLKKLGITERFVQENVSCNYLNVLRGLHHQSSIPQGKLVKPIKGKIYDVAVDIRKDSPTYGQWYGHVLTDTNGLMMYIPPNFAHGFLTLEEKTYVHYNCTNVYDPNSQVTILWEDKDINIDWMGIPVGIPIISDKDKQGTPLKNYVPV